MPFFFPLFRRHAADHRRVWQPAGFLLTLLLGTAITSPAQPTTPELAGYQRRLQAQRFDHRYWDASNDSLRKALAGQQADTLRLQTLTQLFNLTDLSQEALPDLYREHREARRLATRLGYPEQEALRQVVAFDELALAPTPNLPAMRDTLLAALQTYDALGGGPQPYLLEWLDATFTQLEQPEASYAFFSRRLLHELKLVNVMNAAICYRMLGRYYGARGDYNQAISQRLRAAELFRTCSTFRYYNENGAVGMLYTEWGNYARALPYLQKALATPGTPPVTFFRVMNRTLARAYLQLGRYPEALRYNAQARQARPPSPRLPPYDRALGLVQQGTIRLAMGQPGRVPSLLREARQLVDSLHIPLRSYGGNCELWATWAGYYQATGDGPRALAAWQTALRQARQEQQSPLRLRYLRALAAACQQQGQAAPAATYGLAALALADTLEAAQVATRIARYEFEQDDRAQQLRVEQLRRAQVRTTAQVQEQQLQLGGLLAGLAGVLGLAVLLWRTTSRQRRDNALLTSQQQQLEAQALRLGELDAAKNQFFANASHELRTPLTLVLAPLETLLAGTSPALPAAVRDSVALAHRQARRLNELVNRILDLTRLQAGRLPVEPVPTAVAGFLRQMVSQFAPLAAARGLTLRGPDVLPEELHLLVDADKVAQILTNLLSNAFNHTPDGGTVTLAATLPAADGYYTLTVRDTGPGIAPTEQERVFERFYQSPQNQAQGGTGLGLALSRELATLLGGTLTLASTLGQGAAFTLRFPAAVVGRPGTSTAGESGAGLATTQEEPDFGQLKTNSRKAGTPSSGALVPPALTPVSRPRVLVVEDEPDLQNYLRTLLSPAYEVLTAPDGQAALELLAREATIDLITTDAMMPRLSGTELLTRLKTNADWAGIPVLMLTARADKAHHQAALLVGVDDYLTKPFSPGELLTRVRALLARQQVRRQFAALPAEAADELVGSPALAAAELPRPAPAETTAPAQLPTPPAVRPLLAEWQARVAGHLADEQFGPAELARLFDLSERTLYRRLGELAGLTPAAWLRELRLNQARQLLEAGNFGSVAEVADAAGFASAKYFSNAYIERFGRRPSDYRTPRQ